MAESTWAGYITALAAGLTVLTLIVNSFLAWHRDRRIEKKVDDVQIINKANHVMLNSEKKERMDYQRALIRFIEEKGLSAPIDQSKPDDKPPENRT